jgi:hypothetical protein
MCILVTLFHPCQSPTIYKPRQRFPRFGRAPSQQYQIPDAPGRVRCDHRTRQRWQDETGLLWDSLRLGVARTRNRPSSGFELTLRWLPRAH